MRRVVVGILTCRRLAMLERLLHTLNDEARDGKEAGVSLGIVVVSNDPETHSDVERLNARLRTRLQLDCSVVEGGGVGIAPGRNRAVRAALHDAALDKDGLIGFLDDDEWVERGWLGAMLETLDDTNADVVAGPVVDVLPESVAGWVSLGRFFERKRHRTGTELPHCYTGNVLARAEVFRRWDQADKDEWFDPALAFVGGEDRAFFRSVRQQGARIVWCDEGIVREEVPAERCNARYLVTRKRRIGQTIGRESRIERGIIGVGISIARSLAWLMIGAVQRLAVLGVKPGAARQAMAIRGWCSTAYGTGVLEGAFGKLDATYES